EAFQRSLPSAGDGPQALEQWRQRLALEGYAAARSCTPPALCAEKEVAENQEALKEVESMVPEGSHVAFLCQSGSFMYDLQVASSDMDFTLVYQAPPEDLLGLTPPKEDFDRQVPKASAFLSCVHTMRRDSGHAEDFAKRGLRTTQDPLGALHFDPEDNQIRKDVAVKKAVDRLNSQKVTSCAEVATIVGVPQNVYLDYIRNEIDTEQNFLQLPWTILLLLSFTVLSMGLLQQDVEFALQEAYDRDIEENANFAWSGAFGHRGLQNVSSIPQFWSWARLGLLPTLVQPAWVYSEPTPAALGPNVPSSNLSALPQSWLFRDYRKAAPMPNDYLHFSKLVGGIRLRQIAADVDDCTLPSLVDPVSFAAWLGKPCTPSSIGALSPERPSAQQFNGFSRTQYLLPGVDTLPEMQRTLLDMEDGCNYAHSIGDLNTCLCDWCKQQPRQPWLDEQTARVEVSYVVFNAQYGLYTYVSINFLFNRGGHVYRFTDMISCFQDPLRTSMGNSIPTAIAIAIWAVLQVKLLIDEIRDAIRTVRSSKHGIWRGLLRDYLHFWNLVDWLSMIVAGMAVFFWLNVRTQVDAVNSLMPATVRATMYPTGQAVGERRAAYQPTAEAWFTAAEQMSLANSACTVTIILYPLVIMLRLFKSFQAQPRLAIVTETIKTAIPELAHFFIVALCMFGCLFVNSIVFFGQDLEAFSTIPRAFHWCLAAVLGHFDWQALKEVGYVNAASWLWIFSI
ncbi:pkd-2, partial [Symbiodinium sp. KB8]